MRKLKLLLKVVFKNLFYKRNKRFKKGLLLLEVLGLLLSINSFYRTLELGLEKALILSIICFFSWSFGLAILFCIVDMEDEERMNNILSQIPESYDFYDRKM